MAAVLAVAVVMGACAGGADDRPGPTVGGPAPHPTTSTPPGVSVAERGLEGAVRWAGWRIEGQRVLTEDRPVGTFVFVEVAVTNLGSTARFDPPAAVVAAGIPDAPLDRERSALPTVPGGGAARATLAFFTGVDPPADAAVVLGRPGEHRGVLPLGPEAVPVSLDPQRVAVDAGGSDGPLTVRVTGLEVGFDVPASHRSLPADRRLLTVSFDVAWSAGALAGVVIHSGSVAVEDPGGLRRGPAPDPGAAPNAIVDPGTERTGLRASFEVPTGTGSGLTFVVTADDGSSEGPRTVAVALPSV